MQYALFTLFSFIPDFLTSMSNTDMKSEVK
jgi:hypothetical protein